MTEYQEAAGRLGHAPSLKELRADVECALTSAQIYKLFGSLPALCQAAGYEYHRPSSTKFTDRQMLKRLQWLHEHLSRAPQPADYREHYDDGFNYYARRWTSFDGALAAAGIAAAQRLSTADDATGALQACNEKLGHVPTQDEYRVWARDVDEETGQVTYPPERPSPRTLRTLFGSYGNALEAAGLEIVADERQRERRISAALAACAQALGSSPTAAEYRTWASTHDQPSLAEVLSGGRKWNECLIQAGLAVNAKPQWTKRDTMEWVRSWRRERGKKRPPREEWDEWAAQQFPVAPRSATVARVLGEGSWIEAWRQS